MRAADWLALAQEPAAACDGAGVTVLALDIGLACGWARTHGRSGVFSVRGIADHGQALALFSDWIDGMLDEEPILYLAVERGYGGNGASGRLKTAMEGVAHAAAWARSIQRTDRSPGEVRKWLLGFGAISKAAEPSKAARERRMDRAVLAAVQARGWWPDSEHAADAAALLACCERVPARECAA